MTDDGKKLFSTARAPFPPGTFSNLAPNKPITSESLAKARRALYAAMREPPSLKPERVFPLLSAAGVEQLRKDCERLGLSDVFEQALAMQAKLDALE